MIWTGVTHRELVLYELGNRCNNKKNDQWLVKNKKYPLHLQALTFYHYLVYWHPPIFFDFPPFTVKISLYHTYPLKWIIRSCILIKTRGWSTIISGKDNNWILKHIVFLQSLNNFAYRFVQFVQHSSKCSPVGIRNSFSKQLDNFFWCL